MCVGVGVGSGWGEEMGGLGWGGDDDGTTAQLQPDSTVHWEEVPTSLPKRLDSVTKQPGPLEEGRETPNSLGSWN